MSNHKAERSEGAMPTRTQRTQRDGHANAKGRWAKGAVRLAFTDQKSIRRGLAANPLCSLCSLWLINLRSLARFVVSLRCA